MRSYPSCWNKTLAQLGFKRKLRKKSKRQDFAKRRSLFETLETRQMLAADTYTVTTLADVAQEGTANDAYWSLREALAHSAVDGIHPGEVDIIDFDTALFSAEVTEQITLADQNNDGVINNDDRFNIGSNLEIIGPGKDWLSISAGGENTETFRILGTGTLDVTISSLTVTGSGAGFALTNYENLTLDSVSVSNNLKAGISNTESGNLTIRNSEVSGNDQGIDNSQGTVVIQDSLITDNGNDGTPPGSGGGVKTYGGDVRIERSTISNNSAREGGGISSSGNYYGFGANLTVVDSTISGNRATSGRGGGISARDYNGWFAYHYNGGTDLSVVTVTNSTISGNSATNNGGGIYSKSPHVTFTNATVTNNTAANGGGVVVKELTSHYTGSDYGSLTVNNTIIAGNTATSGTDNNLKTDYSIIGANNLTSGDPLLAPLGDYGGPTQTHALLQGSPAIDAGSNSAAVGILVDQRGYARNVDDQDTPGSGVDIGAYERGFVVSTAVDEDDNDYSNGDLSLREALALAASSSSTETQRIEFAPSLAGATIELSEGQLTIASDVEIIGPGADQLTIDADGNSRVFNVNDHTNAEVDVTIRDLTITGGLTAGNGGGIFSSENLTLDTVVIVDNHADQGGGVFSNGAGTLELVDSTVDLNTARNGAGVWGKFVAGESLVISGSTISNNTATQNGGGLVFSNAGGSAAQAKITNSTFSGNTGNTTGGLRIGGGASGGNSTDVTIVNTTITGNVATTSSGGGAFFYGTNIDATLHNTIVAGNYRGTAGNTIANNVAGTISINSTYNLFGTTTAGTGGLTGGTGNQFLASNDPQLNDLGDYGGPTKTHALKQGSPAIDAGSNSAAVGILVDQRGYARDVDDQDTPGSGVDIGAYERGFVVSTVVDESDGDYTFGDLSLREALELASESTPTGTHRIEFMPSLSGEIIFDSGQGQLTIASDVEIVGPGVDQLTIDAGQNSRVLSVDDGDNSSSVEVTLSGLTLTGGSVSGNGGGIANSEQLVLDNVVIFDNTAGNFGGGIYTSKYGSLELIDSTVDYNRAHHAGGIWGDFAAGESLIISGSTISNNTAMGAGAATGSGGGLFYKNVNGPAAQAKIINSTFSGNSAGAYTGGLRIRGAGAGGNPTEVTIINTTITGNSTTLGSGGGLFAYQSADVTLHNTIVAGNYHGSVARDIAGPVNSASSNNLVGPGTAPGGANNIVLSGADAGLEPLGDYGGPTKTHALKQGSPAIDAGDRALAIGPDGTSPLANDQRGSQSLRVDRVFGGQIDIGAYEYGAQPLAVADALLIQEQVSAGNSWVATNASGQSVVVWRGDGPEGNGLYVQLVNPMSNSTSMPRLVNLGEQGAVWNAQVAIDDTGNYAVTWGGGATSVGGYRWNVYLRRYRADGAPIDALPVQVSSLSHLIRSSDRPAIVSSGLGRVLVSWRDSDGNLLFRRFSMLGLSLDAAPQVAASAQQGEIVFSSSQRHAAIAPDGSFSLQWGQRDTDQQLHLYLQNFSAGGVRLGDPLEYASDPVDQVPHPGQPFGIYPTPIDSPVTPYDLVADKLGNVIVAWKQVSNWELASSLANYTWAQESLFYRRYSPDTGWSEVTEVTTGQQATQNQCDSAVCLSYSDLVYLDAPGLAVDEAGQVGLAWERVRSHNDIELPTGGSLADATVIAAENSERVYVRWFDAADNPLSDLPVDATADLPIDTQAAKEPSLAAGELGNFLLISRVSSGAFIHDLYGQRFTLPQAVSLDQDGVLVIQDRQSGLQEIVLRSTIRDGQRRVVLNDQVTSVPAASVRAIRIEAGAQDNRIDLSRVTVEHFEQLGQELEPDQLAIEILGGAGNDQIHLPAIGGTAVGGDGDDQIFGSSGADTLLGGSGNDTLLGGAGIDRLEGEQGNDTLRGDAGDDQLLGGDGDDQLFGNEGDDKLYGDVGDDRLDGGTGALDELFGGSDNDTFVLTESSAALVLITDTWGIDTIDLSQATAGAELEIDKIDVQDVFVTAGRKLQIITNSVIENIIGTDQLDILHGNSAANEIRGGSGDDHLFGYGGNDELLGELGSDTLDGGAGDNRLLGGTGNDTLTSSTGVVPLTTTPSGANYFDGGSGNDIYKIHPTTTANNDFEIFDLEGDDTLDLALWTESITVDLSADSSSEYQSLDADANIRLKNKNLAAIENLRSGSADDTLTGHTGRNELLGGDGVDTLDGRGGDDLILLGEQQPGVRELIDDGDNDPALVSFVGAWSESSGGFNRSQRLIAADTAGAQATWNFSNLEPGDYEVYVTWQVDTTVPVTGSSQANFQVNGVAADSVDQSQSVDGQVVYGAAWQRLQGEGTQFTVDSDGTLEVVLDADQPSAGMVYADAVRIVKYNHAPTFTSPPLENNTWVASAGSPLTITATDQDGSLTELTLTDQLVVAPEDTHLTFAPGVSIVELTAGQWHLEFTDTTPAGLHPSGTYPVVLQLTDGEGAQTAQPIFVRIGDAIDPNTVPEITSITYAGATDHLTTFSAAEDVPLELQVTASGTALTYHLGPNAPADAEISSSGLLTWTPSETQDGLHEFEIRVADSSLAPRRVSQMITVEVTETVSTPAVVGGSLALVYASDSTDAQGAYLDFTGVVTTSEESLEAVRIEVDYNYDSAADFERSESFAVTPTEHDPTRGTFVIEPDYSEWTVGTEVTIAVRAIVTRDGVVHRQAIPVTIALTPEETDDAPLVAVNLRQATGLAADNTTIVTTDPTIDGVVTNTDGPVAGLAVEVYETAESTHIGPSTRVGTLRTDAEGRFSFTPAGLTVPAEAEYDSHNYWFVAEEQLPLPETTVISAPVSQTINFVTNVAPSIASLQLQANTGELPDGATDGSNTTSNPALWGQIVDPNGTVAGVVIEFYHDEDPNNSTTTPFSKIDGIAVTDETGAFVYLPAGLTVGIETKIYARAAEWDDYLGQRLAGALQDDLADTNYYQRDRITLTLDPAANATAQVNSLTAKYQVGVDSGTATVVDPTLVGQIVNDGNLAGIAVEFSIVEVNSGASNFEHVDGVVVTDALGKFEFTPVDLTYDTDYVVYVRAVEWDAAGQQRLVGADYQLTLPDDPTTQVNEEQIPTNLRLIEDDSVLQPITDYRLAYDTATGGDLVTAHPTVTGQVDYQGNLSNVLVEFDLDGDLSTVEGSVTPDENGLFEFTPETLTAGTFQVQAWVRVPNYGVRLPEFADGLLAQVDGQLVADWFVDGYTNDWTDGNNNGVPDANEHWLDSVFAADGVTVSEDATTTAGEWFTSDFQRDWTELFADQTSTPQSLFVLDSDGQPDPEVVPQLDPDANLAPTLSGLDSTLGSAFNPTIHGTLVDDGPVGNVRLEFYLQDRILSDGTLGSLLDGSVRTDNEGNFAYTFSHHTAGENIYEVAIYEPVYNAEPVAPQQLPSFTFNVGVHDQLSIPYFGLLHEIDNDNDATMHAAKDATLTGQINIADELPGDPLAGLLGLRTVEFDYNGDGQVDASTFTRSDGSFEFVPAGSGDFINDLTDQAEVRARVATVQTELVDIESESTEVEFQIYSGWNTFTWTVLDNLPPEIVWYELAHDTGLNSASYETLDRVTSNPTLVGRVTNDTGADFLQVEFYHQGEGDSTIAATVTTDADGYFRYEPVGLGLGHWDIRARAVEIDTLSGEIMRSQPRAIVGSGANNSFDGFVLVEAHTPAEPTLTAPPASASANPTITGTINDNEGTGDLTIEFFLDGTTELLGTTTVARDGSFAFTPEGLDFDTHQIVAKAVRRDYQTGDELRSNGFSNSVTLNFNHINNFGVGGFQKTDTPSWVGFTLTGSRSIGAIANDISVQHVEIVQVGLTSQETRESLAIAAIETTLTSTNSTQYEFHYEPESPLAGTYQARLVGLGAEGPVFGAWSTIDVSFSLNLPTLTATVDDLDATGGAVPSIYSAVLTGTVAAASAGSQTAVADDVREVELDLNGDGQVDRTLTVNQVGNYTYDLATAEPGLISLRVRPVHYHTYEVSMVGSIPDDNATRTESERIEGEWVDIEFELLNAAPELVPGSLAATSEPTISGSVTSPVAASVAGLTVEIDHNGDGIAEGTTTVGTDGTFTYTPTEFAASHQDQTITLQLRAIDLYSRSTTLTGEWVEFDFTLSALSSPVVSALDLQADEDPSTEGLRSSDPVLVGSVANLPAGALQVRVEFDHDGDQTADGTARVDLEGNFTYVPTDLAYGNPTIDARVVALVGSETVIGAWFTAAGASAENTGITFNYPNPQPVVINTLSVVDETTATLSGRATVGGYGERTLLEVQVVDGNGQESTNPAHRFTVRTDSNGSFEFTLPELTPGQYNVKVSSLGNTEQGAERSLPAAFDYSPHTVTPTSAITTFVLAYDSGDFDDDGQTAETTLRGTVDHVQSQLSVEFYSDVTDAVLATVPVAADGRFEFRPEFAAAAPAAQTIRARTRWWDPRAGAAGSYQYEHLDWATNPHHVSFTLDPAANTPVSITQFEVWQTQSLGGSLPQTATPTFVGQIVNDGQVAGLTVEFDHNGDGIVDGTAITQPGVGTDGQPIGTFFYQATGLEPSTAVQTITATVVETDAFGSALRGAPHTLDFILTRAPLVRDLRYVPDPAATSWGEVLGELVDTLSTTATLEVEYQFFGAGSQTTPPTTAAELAAWQAATYALSTAPVVDGAFTLPTTSLTAGSATVLARGVSVNNDGQRLAGPWQRISFTTGQQTTAALEIQNLDLPFALDPLASPLVVSDPLITGELDDLSTPYVVEGAFGIVEITAHDTSSSGGTASHTFRTTADATGHFSFTPPLPLGSYDIAAHTIAFDAATGTESSGTSATTSLILIDNTQATVVFDPFSSTTDPTVTGYVINPDGRVGGLRLEFNYLSAIDSSGNGEQDSSAGVDGIAHTVPVDGQGRFTFTPLGLSAGTHTIRARVAEFDLVSGEFEPPLDWSDTSQVASLEITLTAAGPTEPELTADLSEQTSAFDEAELALRDAVFSVIGAVDPESSPESDTEAGQFALGIGDVLLLHKGGAGDVTAEQELAAPVLTLDNSVLSEDFVDEQMLGAEFTTSQGAVLNTDFLFLRDVDVAANYGTFSIVTVFILGINDYMAPSESGLELGEGEYSGIDSSYFFLFEASGTLTPEGHLASATYTLTESVNFNFLHTATLAAIADTPAGTLTTAGDYSFIRREGNQTGGSSSEGILSLTADIVQPFTQDETVRLESWYDQQGTTISDTETTASTARTSDTTEHALATTTTKVVGGLLTTTVAGALTAAASQITVDVAVTADREHTESTTATATFADSASETATDVLTVHDYYEGALQIVATDYTDGERSTQAFGLTESLLTDVTQQGSGSASGGTTPDETWHYSGTTTIDNSSSLSGTFTEAVASGNQITTTLAATLNSSTHSNRQLSGGGSLTYTSDLGAGSDGDQGSSAFALESEIRAQRSVTIHGSDDPGSDAVYEITGNTTIDFTASASQAATFTGSDHSTGTMTDLDHSARQSATATASGKLTSDFHTTPVSDHVVTQFSTELAVQASAGSQTVGTISGGADSDTVVRSNEVATFRVTASQQGETTFTLSAAGLSQQTTEAEVTRQAVLETRSSDFGQNDADLTLTRTVRVNTQDEAYDYRNDNGAETRRGQFSDTTTGNVETIEQASRQASDDTDNDGQPDSIASTYFSISGGTASRGAQGSFSESGGQLAADAVRGDSQSGFVFTTTTYAGSRPADATGSNVQFGGHATSLSRSNSSVLGPVTLIDGIVSSQVERSEQNVFTRERSTDWSNEEVFTYDEPIGSGSPSLATHAFIHGVETTLGTSTSRISSQHSGGSRQPVTSAVTTFAYDSIDRRGQAGGVDYSIGDNGLSFTSSRVVEGHLSTSAVGTVWQAVDGNRSEFDVSTSRSGTADDLSRTTYTETTEEPDDTTTRAQITATSNNRSRTSNSFGGVVATDLQGRIGRDGQVTEGSRVDTNSQTIVQESFRPVSGASRQTHTVQTSSGFAFSSSEGALVTDHEGSLEEGTFTLGSGQEDSTVVRSNSSAYTTGGGTDWTRHSTIFDTSNQTPDLMLKGSYRFDSTSDDSADNGITFDLPNDPQTTNSRSQTQNTTDRHASSGNTTTNSNDTEISTEATRGGQSVTSIEWDRTTTIGDDEFINGIKLTHTVKDKGEHKQTFTSAGNQPGDEQTLDITFESTHADTTRTEAATFLWGAAGRPIRSSLREIDGQQLDYDRQLFYVGNYQFKWQEFEERLEIENDYFASHRLGEDGESAEGGAIVANNYREVSRTTRRGGTFTTGEVTEELQKYEDKTFASTKKHEESTYDASKLTLGTATFTLTTGDDFLLEGRRGGVLASTTNGAEFSEAGSIHESNTLEQKFEFTFGGAHPKTVHTSTRTFSRQGSLDVMRENAIEDSPLGTFVSHIGYSLDKELDNDGKIISGSESIHRKGDEPGYEFEYPFYCHNQGENSSWNCTTTVSLEDANAGDEKEETQGAGSLNKDTFDFSLDSGLGISTEDILNELSGGTDALDNQLEPLGSPSADDYLPSDALPSESLADYLDRKGLERAYNNFPAVPEEDLAEVLRPLGIGAEFASGFIPVVGELQDLYTLFDPNSTLLDQGLSIASLGLNAITLGAAPNFGNKAKILRQIAEEVASKGDEIGEAAVKITKFDDAKKLDFDAVAPKSGVGCFVVGTTALVATTPAPSQPHLEDVVADEYIVLAEPQSDSGRYSSMLVGAGVIVATGFFVADARRHAKRQQLAEARRAAFATLEEDSLA